MVTNPALTEMVAHTRMADMRRTAHRRSDGTLTGMRSRRALGGAASPRRSVGWFLVSVGLRLALPHPRAASAQ
jgi:hypothetical protein